jgi:hypothetical protein
MNRSLGDALEKALTTLLKVRRDQEAATHPWSTVEVPLIGKRQVLTDADIETMQHTIVQAINTQARWDKEKPLPWLPSLPLNPADIRNLKHSEIRRAEDIWLLALAYYAESLHQEWWDPNHPSFKDFLSGVLAARCCPWQLREVAALKNVRRKPLQGLHDRTLCWSTRWMEWEEDCAESPTAEPPPDGAGNSTGLIRW